MTMANYPLTIQKSSGSSLEILYHLGRLTWPDLPVSSDEFGKHVSRSLAVGKSRQTGEYQLTEWVAKLRLRDWWLAMACLQDADKVVRERAWTRLMAGTVPANGRLLTESLAEKARLVHRNDEEARHRAVAGFWGLLLAGGTASSKGPLHRYDGTSPLIPWILTVFHNQLVDETRKKVRETGAIPLDATLPQHLDLPEEVVSRFVIRAKKWLAGLTDREALVLALVWRHGLSQRQVAELLQKHESNVSRDLRRMRDAFQQMTQNLVAGDDSTSDWTEADAWQTCLMREMGHVLAEDPRLGSVQIAQTIDHSTEKMPLSP